MIETWSEGFILNTLKAFKRYKFKGSIIRIQNSFNNPAVFFQHLKSLSNKQEVKCLGLKKIQIDQLYSSQEITNNFYHQQRILEAKKYQKVPDSASPIIVLDNEIHDGHHRVDVCIKAGIKEVECLVYTSQV